MITNDYPYIRAWGRYMRLKKSVVDKKLWMARREGAPANAFAYEYNANINAPHRWVTIDEIITTELRNELEKRVKRAKKGE